jgi:hypothetical protein
MTKVIDFPKGENTTELLVGPFEYWAVIVRGRNIPKLTGRHTSDSGINFIVDGRFMGGPFYGEDANQVAWLLAQALAVGAGYSNFEADSKGMRFASEMVHLGPMPEPTP